MEIYTYRLLFERGWNRCGTFYYKPDLERSCCKLYTPRLEADKFVPRRDQIKALRRIIPLAFEAVE